MHMERIMMLVIVLWSAHTRRPSHVYRQVDVVILVDAWNPESSRGLDRLENFGDDDKVHG